jgi:hypothetical protein
MRWALFVTALAVLACAAPASAQTSPGCAGDTDASQVPKRPGPKLEFGIGPLAQAGQIGAGSAPAVPERSERTHQLLAQLRPQNGPFVLRLNRFFWSDGEAGFRKYLALADRFTSRGYLVELQVRYHPSAAQEGDIAAWNEHVRQVVRRFGANAGVVALQITNEVNLSTSADSSDGSYRDARDALVQGVMAAKDEVRKLGYSQLRIGFNWAYRNDPADEASFWQSLHDKGGQAFVHALDWIGLDAYPGTVFPPAEPPGGERNGMVNAMSSLRCYAGGAGIPGSVPMRVEENGWPTEPPGRSYAQQANALDLMVNAVNDFRGTFNVSDYRWFDLRDGDTSSPLLFQHFGLVDSSYAVKPAFDRYRRLVAALSLHYTSHPRLVLKLRARIRHTRHGGRRCAHGPVRAIVGGRDSTLAVRAIFARGRRSVARDSSPPLSKIVDRGRHRGRDHVHRVRAKVRLRDGRVLYLRRRYRVCAGARTLPLHKRARTAAAG